MGARGPKRMTIEQRYNRHVIKLDGCWSWSGAKSTYGYGVMGGDGRGASPVTAHRVAWSLFRGELRSDEHLMHLCHNPECSNPAHLAIGSMRENLRTSFVVGRLQRKIPLEAMPSIWKRRQAGETLQAIGDTYGCTKQAIKHMIRKHPELLNA